MRNTEVQEARPRPLVRIELESGLRCLIDLQWDTSTRPEEANRADLWQMRDDSGLMSLHALLDGRRSLTYWDPVTAQIRQESDPAMPEQFVSWCRRVHMNLVTSYCRLASYLVTTPRTVERVFSAATGSDSHRPSDAIDSYLDLLGEACRWEGVHSIWATGLVADRTDDANTEHVEFLFDTTDGMPRQAAALRGYLSRLLDCEIFLAWRERPSDGLNEHVTVKRTRELWRERE